MLVLWVKRRGVGAVCVCGGHDCAACVCCSGWRLNRRGGVPVPATSGVVTPVQGPQKLFCDHRSRQSPSVNAPRPGPAKAPSWARNQAARSSARPRHPQPRPRRRRPPSLPPTVPQKPRPAARSRQSPSSPSLSPGPPKPRVPVVSPPQKSPRPRLKQRKSPPSPAPPSPLQPPSPVQPPVPAQPPSPSPVPHKASAPSTAEKRSAAQKLRANTRSPVPRTKTVGRHAQSARSRPANLAQPCPSLSPVPHRRRAGCAWGAAGWVCAGCGWVWRVGCGGSGVSAGCGGRVPGVSRACQGCVGGVCARPDGSSVPRGPRSPPPGAVASSACVLDAGLCACLPVPADWAAASSFFFSACGRPRGLPLFRVRTSRPQGVAPPSPRDRFLFSPCLLHGAFIRLGLLHLKETQDTRASAFRRARRTWLLFACDCFLFFPGDLKRHKTHARSTRNANFPNSQISPPR